MNPQRLLKYVLNVLMKKIRSSWNCCKNFVMFLSWSYEDIRGFDPNIIQHSIPIKEGENPVRKKQRHVNPALKATIRKEVEKILNAHIIFPVKYFEWVSNLVPV
jgi:hypothetical protein